MMNSHRLSLTAVLLLACLNAQAHQGEAPGVVTVAAESVAGSPATGIDSGPYRMDHDGVDDLLANVAQDASARLERFLSQNLQQADRQFAPEGASS